MSWQTLFGTSMLTVAFAAFLRILGFATETPSYIEVHNLEYRVEDGVPYIVQHRTVQVDGPLLIGQWEAWAYIIDGTRLVEVCSGSGGNRYRQGFREHKMAFDYWVGQEGCWDSLPHNAKVKLRAVHTWGEGASREKWSERFVVNKAIPH